MQGQESVVEMQAEATGIHRDGPEAKPTMLLFNIGVQSLKDCTKLTCYKWVMQAMPHLKMQVVQCHCILHCWCRNLARGTLTFWWTQLASAAAVLAELVLGIPTDAFPVVLMVLIALVV